MSVASPPPPASIPKIDILTEDGLVLAQQGKGIGKKREWKRDKSKARDGKRKEEKGKRIRERREGNRTEEKSKEEGKEKGIEK